MDKDKLLKLVDAISSCSDAEEVELDIARGRKTTAREKRMAIALSDIYRFIHGHSKCYHQSWVDDAEKRYKEFVNRNLI